MLCAVMPLNISYNEQGFLCASQTNGMNQPFQHIRTIFRYLNWGGEVMRLMLCVVDRQFNMMIDLQI